MAEKMLVTQALAEKQLLAEKINNQIKEAEFIGVAQKNQDKMIGVQMSREAYEKQAKESYFRILELIRRYQNLDMAIIRSDARTYMETSFGTFSVAEALSLKRRLLNKCEDSEDSRVDFETYLYYKLQRNYSDCMDKIKQEDIRLQVTAEEMRLAALGNSSDKEKTLEEVESYVRENAAELVDPLDVKKKAAVLDETIYRLHMELESGIKLSNASAVIEI